MRFSKHFIFSFSFIFLFTTNCYSFDAEVVHPNINEAASNPTQSILNESLIRIGLPGGRAEFLQGANGVNQRVFQWIRQGGTDEDVGFRALNHFHDPTQPWDNAGLWGEPIDDRMSSSLVWAQEDQRNNATWNVARMNFYQALTTGSKQEYAETFLALGQIMHLYFYTPNGAETPVYHFVDGWSYQIPSEFHAINSEHTTLHDIFFDIGKNIPQEIDPGNVNFLLIYIGQLGNEENGIAVQPFTGTVERIAFHHQPGGQPNYSNIFTIGSNGADLYQLTEASEATPWFFSPAWSRNGEMMAFENHYCTETDSNGLCPGQNYFRNIVVVDLLSELKYPGNILHEFDYDGAPLAGPEFSPDGTQIVYTITATGLGGIFSEQVAVTVIPSPITLTITFPAENTTQARSNTMVTGTVTHAENLETGVLVNGVRALVYGGQFIANHVPLSVGENTIIM